MVIDNDGLLQCFASLRHVSRVKIDRSEIVVSGSEIWADRNRLTQRLLGFRPLLPGDQAIRFFKVLSRSHRNSEFTHGYKSSSSESLSFRAAGTFGSHVHFPSQAPTYLELNAVRSLYLSANRLHMIISCRNIHELHNTSDVHRTFVECEPGTSAQFDTR